MNISTFLIQIIALLIANFIIKPNGYRAISKTPALTVSIRGITFFLISVFLHKGQNIWGYSIIPAIGVMICNYIFDHKSANNIRYLLINLILQFIVVSFMPIKENIFLFNIEDVKSFLTFSQKNYLKILAFAFCLSPSNVLIKLLIDYFIQGISATDSNSKVEFDKESLYRAGRFIGNIERLLTLCLVYEGQYEAIGFLIASKSIIRTREHKADTEYILIGTLLSFGIAIICGILTK